MSSATLLEKTIEKLVVESAKRLGYEELKPLQKQACRLGRMYLLYFPQDMAKASVMHAYPGFLKL